MKKLYNYILFCLISLVLGSCGVSYNADDAILIDQIPSIFPDYKDIVIPPNIAPLNFYIEEEGDAFFVSFEGNENSGFRICSESASIDIPIKKWKKLLELNRGEVIEINISVNKKQEGWSRYNAIQLKVANEEIDSHLAYRLINVAYVLWRKMGLYQRDLTSFNEKPIAVNRNGDGNCMNCHSFSNNNPEYMMFHIRANFGGTVISTPDSLFKVNTKTPYTLSAGAYPAWHPGGKHIAYSMNKVKQNFHAVEKRNEVYDKASDIIVYDIEKNMVTTSPLVSTLGREALPNWSPDGKTLYFIRTEQIDDNLQYDSVYYDLLKVNFDIENNTFSNLDTILSLAGSNKSITFPKISPDGEYILFTKSNHGYFSIYQDESDLYFLEMNTGEVTEYPYNSETVESFHTWSSNSRWIVFSSKRLDKTTTRPFITYIDKDGKCYKPFVMPQKDPLFYKSYKTNYNIPELITGPVKFDNLSMLNVIRGEAMPVDFDDRVDVDALSGATNMKEKIESLH